MIIVELHYVNVVQKENERYIHSTNCKSMCVFMLNVHEFVQQCRAILFVVSQMVLYTVSSCMIVVVDVFIHMKDIKLSSVSMEMTVQAAINGGGAVAVFTSGF